MKGNPVNKAAALVIPAVLLFSLSGCFLLGGGSGTGDADSDSDGSAGGDDREGGSTACLIDKNWQLDVQDAAEKLGEQIASNGLTVISATGEGGQEIFFDQEGFAGSASDLTYTLVVDMTDGLLMTMTQHHEGAPGGNWAWEGDSESTISFSDWSSDYTVTTDTSINGTAAPTSVVPMGGGLDGQTMTVSCDGDTMETQAAGSPFVQVWHAGD